MLNNKEQTSINICKNNGITLIALVITIIVMLILVAVTITMAINGGLFENAGKAVGDTQNELDKEQQIADGKIQIDGIWYNSIDEYLEENDLQEILEKIVKDTATYNEQTNQYLLNINIVRTNIQSELPHVKVSKGNFPLTVESKYGTTYIINKNAEVNLAKKIYFKLYDEEGNFLKEFEACEGWLWIDWTNNIGNETDGFKFSGGINDVLIVQRETSTDWYTVTNAENHSEWWFGDYIVDGGAYYLIP